LKAIEYCTFNDTSLTGLFNDNTNKTKKQTHGLKDCEKVYLHKYYKKGKMLYHVRMAKNDKKKSVIDLSLR